jgi:hypothetical protein
LFVAKVAIIIPRKTLAKSGYESEMKYKPLIILLYFWLHIENQIEMNRAIFIIVFPHFWQLKTSKIIVLKKN